MSVKAAMDMLARRAMSAATLRRKLAARYGGEAAGVAVDTLLARGLLNDDDYAAAYARDRFERGGYGRARIARELAAKGVNSARVRAALDAVIGEDAERRRALEVLDRFFAAPGRDRNSDRDRSAAYRHLAARGYPEDLIGDLIGVSL